MRKILLGTTAVVSAVVGAAVMAPQASAQEAPSVRLGGVFRAYYGYAQQTGQQSSVSSGLPPGPGGPTQNIANNGDPATNIARLGKHDISTDAGIDVIVNGKLANGLVYGAQIALNSSGIEGRQVLGQRSSIGKTTVAIDEMYAFISHPRFGQVRFGDEDGPMGGLMNSGWIAGFGTGGVLGAWESFVTRQNNGRTQTTPGGLGDASKIIYMTPQWAGFDFGASFAPNASVGEDVGCPNNAASGYCDRATAYTGARTTGIYAAGPEYAGRRNEFQIAARWRGNVAGVGIATTVGYIGSSAARDLTSQGSQVEVLNGLNIWQVGAQASYAGFTLGANYTWGDYNFFWGNTLKGDRPGEQVVVGGQYVVGPVTVGANFVTSLFEGGNRDTFTENQSGSTLVRTRTPVNPSAGTNAATMRRWGMGAGVNYRLAPGMDLIAEYVYYSVREQGRDLDVNRAGVQSRGFSNVFLTGVRLAF